MSAAPGPVGTSGSSSSGVLPLIAKGLPGKSSGTMGRPRTLEMTGGGVTSSDPGMNSIGVKFSVLNGRFVGRTRTTRTPVGPRRSSLSSLPLIGCLVVTRGCLARGLVLSGSGCNACCNLLGSALPMVPTGRMRILAPLKPLPAASVVVVDCSAGN